MGLLRDQECQRCAEPFNWPSFCCFMVVAGYCCSVQQREYTSSTSPAQACQQFPVQPAWHARAANAWFGEEHAAVPVCPAHHHTVLCLWPAGCFPIRGPAVSAAEPGTKTGSHRVHTVSDRYCGAVLCSSTQTLGSVPHAPCLLSRVLCKWCCMVKLSYPFVLLCIIQPHTRVSHLPRT